MAILLKTAYFFIEHRWISSVVTVTIWPNDISGSPATCVFFKEKHWTNRNGLVKGMCLDQITHIQIYRRGLKGVYLWVVS